MSKLKETLIVILSIIPLTICAKPPAFAPGAINGIANIIFDANAFQAGDGNLSIKLLSISYYTAYNGTTCSGTSLGTVPGDTSGAFWNTGIALPTSTTSNIGHIGLIGARLDQDVAFLTPPRDPTTGDCVIYNNTYQTSNGAISIIATPMICYNLVATNNHYTSCTPKGNVTLTRSV